MNLPADILAFWFEGVDDSTPIDKGKRPFNKWFKAGKALDREIRERFEGDLNNAFAGKYKEWEQSPRGALAVVLLYDQLTRNMYRDTPGMYMADAPAQELALQLTSGKKERTLSLIERVFVYMPLMHAEDIRAQCLSVGYFTELVEESRKKNPGNTHYYSYSLDYANRHYVIIERFGRFPHRNKILGRTSTPEEIEFLKKPGSGF
ncbi:MAG: hypothetical protein A2Y05_00475 [Omnitrophica WOR_2 bacterium GWA2_53_43]|nr:MAG: hypothetical protein A2Y05_00475 [Omnitrophica WOR_2 bacterium GWA2_53_43]